MPFGLSPFARSPGYLCLFPSNREEVLKLWDVRIRPTNRRNHLNTPVHSPTPSVTGFETPDSPYEAPNGSRRLVLYQSSSSTTVDQIHPVDPGQCTFLGPRVPTTRKRHLLAMASTLSSDGLHPSSYVVNLESFNCSFQPSCSSKVFPEKRLAAKSLFTKAAFSSPQKTAQPDFGRWSFARASSSRTPKAESVPGCGSLDMGRWFPPGFP